MKRLALLTLALLLACACLAARAEIVGTTGAGDFIHRLQVPGGDPVFFVSSREAPEYHLEDVNFDGQLDLVVQVELGASNDWNEFFVRDGDQYVRADHPASEFGVCRYTLLPERGWVESSSNDGFAGLMHTRALYRWEGTDLRLVRYAEARYLPPDESGYPESDAYDWVRCTVYAFPADAGEYRYEGEAVWEMDVRTDQVPDDLFDLEDAAFYPES